MKKVSFSQNPLNGQATCGLPISHDKWFKAQFRYFKEDCKLRREKKIEDFILNNNFKQIHHIRDNPVLVNFFQSTPLIKQVPINQAELLIITDQKFSRLTTKNIILNLKQYLKLVPKIYLCLNKHYLNYNDAGEFDSSLPDDYDTAITVWLRKKLPNYSIHNISLNFKESGSDFTWVLPPCEYLICRN
jgi:hypothetical protein